MLKITGKIDAIKRVREIGRIPEIIKNEAGRYEIAPSYMGPKEAKELVEGIMAYAVVEYLRDSLAQAERAIVRPESAYNTLSRDPNPDW